MKAILLAAGMVMAAGQAGAQTTTSGNDLYEACNSPDASMQGFCIGMVIGIIEGIRYGLAVPMFSAGGYTAEKINQTSNALLRYCPPEHVENGQNVDVVKIYLRDNPSERHMPARLLVHLSLAKAFPCEQ